MKWLKSLALIAIATQLSACAFNSSLQKSIDAYKQYKTSKLNYPLTREVIDGQPYSVMGAQVDDGPRGLLVLRAQNEKINQWAADNGVVVSLKNGRVVRTVGFPEDVLAIVDLSGADPLGKPLNTTQTYNFLSRIDLAPANYGLSADHQLRFVGLEKLDIYHRVTPLNHWRETIRIRELRKQWTQDFWLDPNTGEVWRSAQNIGGKSKLVLETLKAPPL